MSNADYLASYLKRQEERLAKFMAQEPVKYAVGQPVYSEDSERYYPDFQTCVEEYWDDSRSPETALVFECTTELAATPDLVEYVDERWSDELEDWDGVSQKVTDILRFAEDAIRDLAPTIWYPDYKRRLIFDYSGFPEVEEGE